MGLPEVNVSGGNLNDSGLKKKIESFFNKYINKYQEKLKERKFPLGQFSFSRPTNYYFFVDKKKIHLIYTSQFAGGIAEILYVDLRDQEKEEFSIEELGLFLRAQKGITKTSGLSFDIGVLDKSSDEQDKVINTINEDQIKKEYNLLIKKHQPLFISKEQIIKFLDLSNEDDLTNILLVPLLRHLGFITAESKGHRDRTLEFGQDIQRMKIQLPTGHWLYFSAQVKKGDIKANTKAQEENVERVLTQTQMQLEWEMPDTETNQNVKPDHVLLMVSGDITEAAKQYIFKHSLYQRKRILLWEKEKIINLCLEKGLPEQVQKTILEYNKRTIK